MDLTSRPAGEAASPFASHSVRMALASRRAVGLEVTIFNPGLDPDGTAGRALTDLLASALSPVGSKPRERA